MGGVTDATQVGGVTDATVGTSGAAVVGVIDALFGTSVFDVGGSTNAADCTGGTNFDGIVKTVEAGSEMWHPMAANWDLKA